MEENILLKKLFASDPEEETTQSNEDVPENDWDIETDNDTMEKSENNDTEKRIEK